MTTATEHTAAPGQYITFKLGDEVFAINVLNVREVLDLTPITRVPSAPPYMRGVVNVRGKAIPVVDLRAKFGLPVAADTVHTRILVIEVEIDGEAVVVGGQSDSVREVIELDASQLAPAPRIATRWRSQLVRGMTRRGEDFVTILDVEKIFSFDDLMVSAQIAEAD
jgi:purine-binding chemotaxis protein CheW